MDLNLYHSLSAFHFGGESIRIHKRSQRTGKAQKTIGYPNGLTIICGTKIPVANILGNDRPLVPNIYKYRELEDDFGIDMAASCGFRTCPPMQS